MFHEREDGTDAGKLVAFGLDVGILPDLRMAFKENFEESRFGYRFVISREKGERIVDVSQVGVILCDRDVAGLLPVVELANEETKVGCGEPGFKESLEIVVKVCVGGCIDVGFVRESIPSNFVVRA